MTKCVECGRFMNLGKPHYWWITYGNSLDTEPNEPEHMHDSCWEILTERYRKLIIETSWQFCEPTYEMEFFDIPQ